MASEPATSGVDRGVDQVLGPASVDNSSEQNYPASFLRVRSWAEDVALGGSQAGKAPDFGSGSEGSIPSRPTRGDEGGPRSVKGEIKLFTGNSNRPLAEAISVHLGVPLGGAEIGRFSDGEVQVEITENVRGGDVFVIQSTSMPTNDNLMELLLMLDAFKRASAKRITAVIPYYGYARQDRKVAPRVPISAKLVADLITTAGASRVLTVDLHAGQIQGFFDIPVDNVYATPVLLQYLRERLGNREVTVDRARCRRRGTRARVRQAARCQPRHHRQAAHPGQRRRRDADHRRGRRARGCDHRRHGRHRGHALHGGGGGARALVRRWCWRARRTRCCRDRRCRESGSLRWTSWWSPTRFRCSIGGCREPKRSRCCRLLHCSAEAIRRTHEEASISSLFV